MKELLIRITDELEDAVREAKPSDKTCPVLEMFKDALRKGVVLPKGHGRLGDLDEYAHCSTDDVPTIIEADTWGR